MSVETVYLRALCDISNAFASAERKDKLLNRIIESALDSMNARAACLFLGDENGRYTPAARKGGSKEYFSAGPHFDQKMISRMRKEGYLHIRDIQKTEYGKDMKGIASVLAVPVDINNRPAGVLALYNAEPLDFSETDIRFLTALAEQGGIAIDRARLIEQLRNNARIFHDLSAGISSSLEIQEIMRMLTEGVARALNAKAVSVRLIDTSAEALRLISSFGLSDAYLEKGNVDEDAGMQESLAGESVIIHDADTDQGVQYRREKAAEGIVSIVTVPIRAQKDVIGVLRVYYGSRRTVYPDELMMIEAVGNQAGLAIQNASVYINLQKEMKDLQSDIWSHRSWF